MKYFNHNILLFAALAIPAILLFQNCGQPGSIGMQAAGLDSKTAPNGLPTDSPTDDLIIDPDTGTSSGGNGGTDSGNGTSGGGNTGGGGTGSTDPSNGGSGSTSGKMSCDGIVISDILLSIKSVTSSLSIIDDDMMISLSNPTLKLMATKSGKLKNLNLILNAQGNKLLTNENISLNLKTPSGQTSGIKIHLRQDVSLEAGKTYLLKLNIDPAAQTVTNPSKCIFKPVIKDADLVLN